MARLVENPDLRTALSEGALRNANEHRIDKIGERLESIYQEAIDAFA
jgi:hypothetical protein